MKKMVSYFSASGTTRDVACQLSKLVGGKMHEIVPAKKYEHADLDWTDRSSRCTIEMQNPDSRPQLAEEKTDLSGYDVLYIGFPIWWGVAPRLINTFIENNDLSGKQIVLFATSGGSEIAAALKDLKEKYPDLNIVGGKMLKGTVTEDIL